MIQLLPFCGWRFDLSQVGALSEVLSPSFELLDDSARRELYRRHPCNAVRVISNRDEPGDTSPDDRISRTDEFFRLWKREGILIREHDPAFYVVETAFQFEGVSLSRWSVTGLLRLPEAGETAGLRSEAASAELVQERLALRRRCRAGFVPVIALVSDSDSSSTSSSLPDMLEVMVRSIPPIESPVEADVRCRLWPLTGRDARNEIMSRMAMQQFVCHSGTAEYAAAVLYRDELISNGLLTDPNDAAQFVLASMISIDDPGLLVTSSRIRVPDFLQPSQSQDLARESQFRVHPLEPAGFVFASLDHGESA
jgi:hypothetical protein